MGLALLDIVVSLFLSLSAPKAQIFFQEESRKCVFAHLLLCGPQETEHVVVMEMVATYSLS